MASVRVLCGGYTWQELQLGIYRSSGRKIPKRTLEYWLSQLGIQAIKPPGHRQGRLYPDTAMAQLKFAAKQLQRGLTFADIRQRLLEIEQDAEATSHSGTESEPVTVQTIDL